MSKFRVLGHRGAILPEAPFYQNSRAAFAEALATADGFESDACASADGDIFLIHEAKYVHAQTGVEYCLAEHLDAPSQKQVAGRRLDQLTTAEIRRLRLKDGSPMPELADVLAQVAAVPGAVMDIELKGHHVLPAVLATLNAGPLPPEQVILSSFDHLALREARQLAPPYKLGALFAAADTPPAPMHPWVAQGMATYRPFTALELASPLLREIGPDYLIVPDKELTLPALDLMAQAMPQAQLMAWVFTERGGVSAEHLIATTRALAATGRLAALIVDHPRALSEPLKQAAQYGL